MKIDQPGIYTLRETVTIVSDKVTLMGDDSVLKNISIEVVVGISNICIENIKLEEVSGICIKFHGKNQHIFLKNVYLKNCGYGGSSNIVFGDNCSDIHIVDCYFVECGILRKGDLLQYGDVCTAVSIHRAKNLVIKNCTVDGCVARTIAKGLDLVSIDNVLVDNFFVTDVLSQGSANGIYSYDIDGIMKGIQQTAIVSNVKPHQIVSILDHHETSAVFKIDDQIHNVDALHISNVIPLHEEMLEELFKEHKWRSFRTVYRKVCHNSHSKSQTSAIYGKWVEIFCKQVLGVAVKVTGAFANLYENGLVPLPLHRDVYNHWIFGLSFGETRTLEFVSDNSVSENPHFTLEGGDIFIFSPKANETHQHRMNPEPERQNKRINVTYFLEVGSNEYKLLEKPITMNNIPTFEEAKKQYDETKIVEEKTKELFQDEYGNLYEKIGDKYSLYKESL